MAQCAIGCGLVPQIKGLLGGVDQRWLTVAASKANNNVGQRKRYKPYLEQMHVLHSGRGDASAGPPPLKSGNQYQADYGLQEGRRRVISREGTPCPEEQHRPDAQDHYDGQRSYKEPLAEPPPPQSPSGYPTYPAPGEQYPPQQLPLQQVGSLPYNQSGYPNPSYPHMPPGAGPPRTDAGYPHYVAPSGQYPPQQLYPQQGGYPPYNQGVYPPYNQGVNPSYPHTPPGAGPPRTDAGYPHYVAPGGQCPPQQLYPQQGGYPPYNQGVYPPYNQGVYPYPPYPTYMPLAVGSPPPHVGYPQSPVPGGQYPPQQPYPQQGGYPPAQQQLQRLKDMMEIIQSGLSIVDTITNGNFDDFNFT